MATKWLPGAKIYMEMVTMCTVLAPLDNM